MNEAIKMERTNTSVGSLGNFTLNYFNQVLEPNFVKELMGVFGVNSKELIKEFIFGVDILVELLDDQEVPRNVLLNNSDVTAALAFYMKDRAIFSGNAGYFGCQVAPRTKDLIEELFEHKYLRLFHFIFNELNKPLIFSLDGVGYYIGIEVPLCQITFHSGLCFKRSGTVNNTVLIPFSTNRLYK